MAATSHSQLPWAPEEALGVFMGLLSEIEAATPASSEFYNRLCEATCRLAHLSRAVIFLWDDARRERCGARARRGRHRGLPSARRFVVVDAFGLVATTKRLALGKPR